MEENDKKTKLENFTKNICQKYNLDEKILLENIDDQDKNKFWNTLIELINKKDELQKASNPVIDDNNNNTENDNPIFNKEELIKEIDNYFKENPDEENEIWNNYKNKDTNTNSNNTNIESIKDNNNPIENVPTSKSNDKKIGKIVATSASYKSYKKKETFIIKKNNPNLRFSIRPQVKRKHQSIIAPPKVNQSNDNSNLLSINPANNNNNKRDSIHKMVKSKFCKDNDNKLRRSLALKVDNNANFEYNSKKPYKSRKSVMAQPYHFKFNLNNNFEKKKSMVIEGNKVKNKFNENENKNTPEVIKEEEIENKGTLVFYKEAESNSEKNKNKNEEPNKNENDKNVNEDNNNMDKPIDDNGVNINKVFSVYKYKNTVSTIYKKEKPKPKPKKESKKYLNNSICHQVSISLNIKNEKNNESKSKINNNTSFTNEKGVKKIKVPKSNKNVNKENNNINVLYKKEEIKKPDKSSNDIDDDNILDTDRRLFSSDQKKRNRQRINNNNYNNSRIKIYNNSFYRININETYNLNNFRSSENIYNPKTNEPHYMNSYSNSKKEIKPKKAEIRYYKRSGRKNNTKNNSSSRKRIDVSNIKINSGSTERIQPRKIKIIRKNDIQNNTISVQSKQKPFIQMYKDVINNLMKNDDSIYKANYIFYTKKKKKKTHKIGNSSETKKKKGSQVKINFNWKNSKINRNDRKINTSQKKKNVFSSCDNIHKSKHVNN